MIDEAGIDYKILSVPIDKLTPLYSNIKNFTDLNLSILIKIEHFFKHYKDLENNKWASVGKWEDSFKTKEKIMECINKFT
jgi:inorganic pyrophosphatase